MCGNVKQWRRDRHHRSARRRTAHHERMEENYSGGFAGVGRYPSQASTGSRGYLGNFGLVAELQPGIQRAGAAREQVRAARRLLDLPLVRDAFAEGTLTFSKVRPSFRIL